MTVKLFKSLSKKEEKLIDPKDTSKAIILLHERIKVKKDLVRFTEMEIGEIERTIEKMEKPKL